MSNFCKNCGTPFSFFQRFSRRELCDTCLAKEKAERAKIEAQYQSDLTRIKNTIIDTKTLTDPEMDFLKKSHKSDQIRIFSEIWENFSNDKELDKGELESLITYQKQLNLSNEDVKYDERILPYQYVYMIRNEGKLPVVHFEGDSASIVLKKNETAHFATTAFWKEMKSVNLGYVGGSHGFSFRVAKGVSYRVGAYRGHMVKEDRLVEKSRGHLILTNTRLIFHPVIGQKGTNIPLNKIISYNCYDNGVEIQKDGREKMFFFQLVNGGLSETLGLSLGFLLEQNK
ncbi:hypothetical protein [Methanoregula sp.]|uniref:hypothetical protein n=1 Tax=Methanoregula sp. TaxID=2052170 RepID=UPI00236C3020|nr:hypothetical protein [Methanoregula sp.]MDD1686247.1 hypothetical protein [Methanoregula sp.]